MALKSIDTIRLKRRESSNEYGEIVYAEETTFKGRWNDKVEQVLTNNGLVLVSTSSIYTDYSIQPKLKTGDLIKFSEDEEEDFQPIRATKTSRNSSGSKVLYTAYLGE